MLLTEAVCLRRCRALRIQAVAAARACETATASSVGWREAGQRAYALRLCVGRVAEVKLLRGVRRGLRAPLGDIRPLLVELQGCVVLL